MTMKLKNITEKCLILFRSLIYSYSIATKNLPSMAGPQSSSVTEVFMSYLEDLEWHQYVDDIFCAWDSPEESLTFFQHIINFFHPSLSFTIENSTSSLNFLDFIIHLIPHNDLLISSFSIF